MSAFLHVELGPRCEFMGFLFVPLFSVFVSVSAHRLKSPVEKHRNTEVRNGRRFNSTNQTHVPVVRSSSVPSPCQAIEKVESDDGVPYVPYTSVPLRSSVAGCHVAPCFTRRTNTHPPPWNESSQKYLGATTQLNQPGGIASFGPKDNELIRKTSIKIKLLIARAYGMHRSCAQTHWLHCC
jgi:hypothetical protein